MAEWAEFQKKQLAFAAHIRDPERNLPPEGIEDRRMAIYRELFFNNLFKLLGSTFPVLKKLHSEDQWNALVREFMVRHQAQTPYFLEIPQEFLAFLENEHVATDDDYPFLYELAHYEWAELALSVSEASDDLSRLDTGGDLLQGVPVKSALAWALSYRYPVHRISPDFRPDAPGEQPTFLAIWRKPDDELGFMELNPVSARLLDLIDANDEQLNGADLLRALAAELSYPDPDAFLQHGAVALQELHSHGIVPGVLKDH